jgi:hypothetical protein
VVGFVAAVLLKDRSSYDHSQEYEEQEIPAQAVTRRAMG